MSKQSDYWIDLSEYDLDSARVMFGGSKYLYVAFMCHQAIEKGLKAVISITETPPKIHNLLRLAENAKLLENMNIEQQEFIEDLNPMNIEARYPAYKNKISASLTIEKCDELIKQTEELLCWIKKQL